LYGASRVTRAGGAGSLFGAWQLLVVRRPARLRRAGRREVRLRL